MSNQPLTPNAVDAHDDLLAILAAGRELGPEMDQALVESYLRKHPAPAAARQTTAATQPAAGRVWPMYPFVGSIGFLLAVVAFVAVLVASGGHAIWLIWLPIVLGSWWWRRWPGYGRGRWGYYGSYPDRSARHDD